MQDNNQILFFIYSLEKSETEDQFRLEINRICGGNKEEFAQIFEPLALPETETFIQIIKQRIENKTSAFMLYESMGKAAELFAEQVSDELQE